MKVHRFTKPEPYNIGIVYPVKVKSVNDDGSFTGTFDYDRMNTVKKINAIIHDIVLQCYQYQYKFKKTVPTTIVQEKVRKIMINSTEIFEAKNEREVMFLQVTTLINFVNPIPDKGSEYVTRYLSKEASIDDVCRNLKDILYKGCQVPMHVYTVASSVAMGYTDREKYNSIRNTLMPLYWYYGITDLQ